MQAAQRSTFSNDQRKAIAPRRYEMERALNQEQRFALRQCEQFGLQLRFVRRPLFCEPLPLLQDRDNGEYALMEADGSLNYQHGLTIRAD